MARYIDANLIKGKLQNTIINSQTAFINTVLIGLLDKAPTEDVQKVKHGEFNDITDFGNGVCVGYCSNCGTEHRAINPSVLKLSYRFCRWCGAKMDGV